METPAQNLSAAPGPAPEPAAPAAGSLEPTQLLAYGKAREAGQRCHLVNLGTPGSLPLCGVAIQDWLADGYSVYLAQDAGTLLRQPDLFSNLWQPVPLAQQVDCKTCQAQLARMLADGRITPAKVQYLAEPPAPSKYRGAAPSASGPQRPRVSTPKTITPTTPKPPKPNMKKELAQKVYNQVIKDLHTLISRYQAADGSGRVGITAFAEAHGMGRQNLQKIFTQNANSISVGVYLKVLVGLGLVPAEALAELDMAEYTVSLRALLQLDTLFLMGTTTQVHLATLAEDAPAHV